MHLCTNSRPICATIHLEAVRHNLATFRRAVKESKVWAVVKANAYGHGIKNVYDALRAADGFACLDLLEAQTLRHLGWRAPILLLEGAFEPRDLEWCSRLNLWHVIHCDQQIDWLAAHKTHEPHRVFLKMNSGMNRLGFTVDAYRAAYARLSALTQVAEISHLTHYSDADVLTQTASNKMMQQWQTFQQATHDLAGETSLANSAAALHHSVPHGDGSSGDWVRAGIALYGAAPDYPAQNAAGWSLQAAMTLSSRIVSVQTLTAGQSVGYGSHFVADHPMRIGIVACGYADGYPRHASTCSQGAPVLVEGERTCTVGRISMDMLAVDLTCLPQADIGSRVTLWGRADPRDPQSPVLPIEEVADSAGTIAYELMCAVAARVPQVLEEGA